MGALLAGGALPACSDPAPPGPAPSSSSSAPEAAPSPFSIVLRSARPITFSELAGGVAVADSGKAQLARAAADGELVAEAMPAGLPEATGSILKMAGRHPDSLWLTYEIPGGDEKKAAKHPLLRLDGRKKQWKEYAADWRPLLGVWSKGRIVAASTSSGKLKIKVMEPYSKKAPADLPNPKVDDAECDKTLRVDAMAPLASGAVWMAGTCKPAGAAKRRHVAVFWAPFDEAAAPGASASASAKAAAPAASASASAKTAAAPAASASASAEGKVEPASASAKAEAAPSVAVSAAASAAPTGAASVAPSGTAGPVDDPAAGEAEEPKGPPGKVLVLPAGSAHRGWAVVSEQDVWILGGGETGKASRLHRWTGENFEEVELASPEMEAIAIAQAADGTLWVVSEHAVFKRGADGKWENVPLPDGALGGKGASWDILALAAVGKDVWVSARAKVAETSTEHDVVLRLRAAKDVLHWQ